MKKSEQYLLLAVMFAVLAAFVTKVVVYIKESGHFSNGYNTFNITGFEDTFSVLFIMGATIAASVFVFTKTVSFTNKRVTN